MTGNGSVDSPYLVDNEAGMLEALSNGGYIKLIDNISLGCYYSASNVYIDLNGFKITSNIEENAPLNGIEYVIYNGSIDISADSINVFSLLNRSTAIRFENVNFNLNMKDSYLVQSYYDREHSLTFKNIKLDGSITINNKGNACLVYITGRTGFSINHLEVEDNLVMNIDGGIRTEFVWTGLYDLIDLTCSSIKGYKCNRVINLYKAGNSSIINGIDTFVASDVYGGTLAGHIVNGTYAEKLIEKLEIKLKVNNFIDYSVYPGKVVNDTISEIGGIAYNLASRQGYTGLNYIYISWAIVRISIYNQTDNVKVSGFFTNNTFGNTNLYINYSIILCENGTLEKLLGSSDNNLRIPTIVLLTNNGSYMDKAANLYPEEYDLVELKSKALYEGYFFQFDIDNSRYYEGSNYFKPKYNLYEQIDLQWNIDDVTNDGYPFIYTDTKDLKHLCIYNKSKSRVLNIPFYEDGELRVVVNGKLKYLRLVDESSEKASPIRVYNKSANKIYRISY